MAEDSTNKTSENIFLRMHPLHRLLISLALAAIVFFFIRKCGLSTLTELIILWDVIAFTLIVTSWTVFLTRTVFKIRQLARKEDGSLSFVFLLVVISSFASMFAVTLLIISKDTTKAAELLYVPVSVAGMLLSWIMVHTTFCFHYAHMYYDDDDNDSEKHAGGLDFPSEKKPDYLDFAYFSFVIGMTFQVSDVEISSRKIRRLALVHGLLSFMLNTFVVALSINLIAGLKG
jgi:uncharacterized membrane protein